MSVPLSNRFERRRTETRQALVRAARGRGLRLRLPPLRLQAGPVRRGRARCDEEFAQAIDERLHGVDDPAERLAGGLRLSARLAESHPEVMRILCHSELGRICAGSGLAPRARRDVDQGIASRRFIVIDPVIALSALDGSLLAFLEPWFSKPKVDIDQAAGAMAEMLLHMLGLSPYEARDLARGPLSAAGSTPTARTSACRRSSSAAATRSTTTSTGRRCRRGSTLASPRCTPPTPL
ncbi:TetR/AcrR family transcriptional regulator [Streptomyces sp. NPDC051917]|uniref:TetR/AcrR family transcriptional regulator n=1 Tax=Streptomyces sp. NPDC051917 TaxID=3154754 RepID=UPI003456DBFC